MIKKLREIYKKQQFNPGLLGIFINPFYFARKGLYQEILKLTPDIKGQLLDIGCGSKPYKDLFFKVEKYIGLEIKDKGNRNHRYADVLYDGKIMPFKNEEFDCIFLSQVFEHVFNPYDFLKEINRITKKEGFLLLTVPFIWDEHEIPYDYARYTYFGLKYLLESYGFQLIYFKKSVNGIGAICQLLSGYIYKKTLTSHRFLNLLLTIILISPINIIGILLSKILPKSEDLYLDNIVLARKVKNV